MNVIALERQPGPFPVAGGWSYGSGAGVAPCALLSTLFESSGAEEGIQTAIRLDRAYTGRHDVITLTDSFHGRTAGTLSLIGKEARNTQGWIARSKCSTMR